MHNVTLYLNVILNCNCFDSSAQAELGRENEAMSSFVNGVNCIVKSPVTPKSQTSSSHSGKTPQSTNDQNTQAYTKISCSKDYFDDEDLVSFCKFRHFRFF